MLRTIGHFAVMFAIPALSWLGLQYYGQGLSGAMVNGVCKSTNNWAGECALVAYLPSLEKVVTYAFIAAGTPIVVFFVIAVLCGANRRMNALIFPALIPVALFFAAVNLLIQGGLLLMDLYAIFAYATGFIRFILLRLAAVILILGVFLTLMRIFLTDIEYALPVRATPLALRLGRPMLAKIASIADRLDAPPPHNVIVGLEPETWATACPVQLIGQGAPGRLQGITLHISLTQMRLLDEDQLTAIIAAEIAQFQRPNLRYATAFMPLYASTSRAFRHRPPDRMLSMRPADNAGILNLWQIFVDIATVPVRAVLGLLATCFSANVRRIGRRQTKLTDRAAAEIAGAGPLGTAIVRSQAFGPIWPRLIATHLERAERQKRLCANLPEAFADFAAFGPPPRASRRLLHRRQPHPVNTPLITKRRLSLLGLSPGRHRDAALGMAQSLDGPTELLPGQRDLDFEMTELENRWLYVSDSMTLPPNSASEETPAPFYLSLHGLLAPLIVGGRLPQRRFDKAADDGAILFEDFDVFDLAAACTGRLPVPEVSEALLRLARQTPDHERPDVLALIRATLGADGGPDPAERELLAHIEGVLAPGSHALDLRRVGDPPLAPASGSV